MADVEIKYCLICKEPIIGQKNRNRMYCSPKCNQKADRERKKLQRNLFKQGGIISEQDKRIIQSSNEFVKDTIQAKIPVLNTVVGKDLTECKREDGKHLYTQTDLWILMAKLIRYVFRTDKSNPISFLGVPSPEELIHEFERKFKCKFSDVKKSNPDIKPADNDFLNGYIMTKYANLPYSCDTNQKSTGWE